MRCYIKVRCTTRWPDRYIHCKVMQFFYSCSPCDWRSFPFPSVVHFWFFVFYFLVFAHFPFPFLLKWILLSFLSISNSLFSAFSFHLD